MCKHGLLKTCLKENDVPQEVLKVETDDKAEGNDSESTKQATLDDEDKLYDESTVVNTLLPIADQKQPEENVIRSQLSGKEQILEWPLIDESNPLNEYLTPFLATLAFPTLFPDGRGDPTDPALVRNVTFHDRVKHLIKFGEYIDGKLIYRFANHPRFAYWALNMIQRKRVLEQGSVFLKQNPNEAHLTIDELREMAENNNSNQLMSKLTRYVGNIPGTNAYWHRVKEDLKAIVTHEGAGTIFFTFSSADMHWPELHDLLTSPSENTTSQQRRQNVIDNPHIVDWFFTERLESFVKHWLYNTFGAKWHWFRFECQHRGSIHCHGTAKLENDPGLCELTNIALKGYLAQKEREQTNVEGMTELDQVIESGKEAERKVCQYTDWLLSTVNPLPPEDETFVKPDLHPCQKRHKDIPEHKCESDYVDLVNTVQRHTHCSTSYCLRKKSDKSELKCRFHFPFDHCPRTRIEFEEIHSRSGNKTYKAKIVTERNDPRLNKQCQLQGWRANCDIQIIIDHYACVEYLTKYAAKCEPKSPLLNQLFNSVIQCAGDSSDPQKAIKKIAMKTLGERDYAAQETMHHLLSLKLHSSTFKVIPVSLTGSRRVKIMKHDEQDGDDNDLSTENSLLDMYAHRDQHEDSAEMTDMNFAQFATKFKVYKDKLTRLPDNVIPRIFPSCSANPKGSHYALCCKFQLIRYKPWTVSQNNLWHEDEPSDETIVNCWHEFLQTPYAQVNVPEWFDRLQDVIRSQEHDVIPVEQPPNTREEWMILADLHTPFENSNGNEANHDWEQDRAEYNEQLIGEMPSWIERRKEDQSDQTNEQLIAINPESLNEMQKLAYDIVDTHLNDDSNDKDPLFLIINGVAGTGKSFVINAIRYLLQSKCAVTATTGKAAFNIQGITIHSLLKLPVGVRNQKELSGESLCRLQQTLRGIDYIIIDEYSMLGQVAFGWVDRRCRQATGLGDKMFGRMSLILVGDPGQLPPVADKPLYHAKPSNDIGLQGCIAYMMFDKVVKLTVNQRVHGASNEQSQFRDLLQRLRLGQSTVKDWNMLLTRQPSNFTGLSEFSDAVRLFYSNEQVGNYNHDKLLMLNQPVATVEARHSSAAAKKISSDEMYGLQPVIYLARNAKVMLTMNLWPSVGLCNGATGTVVDIIYQTGLQPPSLPIAVVIHFDDYRGPSLCDSKPGCVPICPITVTSQSLTCTYERQQLPLRLAWALTIHKSQGLTLPKAWIDLGKSEKTVGVSYVGISRVKTLSSVIIEPMPFERLTSFSSSYNFRYQSQEEARLDHIAQITHSQYEP